MLADTLHMLGYRPEDDSWDADGRGAYTHDDDATRAYLTTLRGILGRQGWERDQRWHPAPRPIALRTFRRGGEIIEIEPGGADTNGHYLHHMKAAVLA